jgi:diadenosine tetraphosphate (Ap4A) HIT family hydrolase
MAFALHPRLAAGAFAVAEWPLCMVLLKDDARWPWLVLVPRITGLSEWRDLKDADQIALTREISAACKAVAGLPGVARTNVGALGNQVEQFHVHVVGRWPGDPAWPDAVWGRPGKVAYETGDAAALVARLSAIRP